MKHKSTISKFNSSSLSSNDTLVVASKDAGLSSQLIGIIIAAISILIAIIILLILLIYQKLRIRNQKVCLTSNNPCYVSEDTRNIQGHCNLSVTNDVEDEVEDNAPSLDNDSFLNSLEHLQFVGYLNLSRQQQMTPSYNSSIYGSQHYYHHHHPHQQLPRTSVDHSLSRLSSQSTIHSNRPIYPSRSQHSTNHKSPSSKHSSSQSRRKNQLNTQKPSEPTTNVQLRVRKSSANENPQQSTTTTLSTQQQQPTYNNKPQRSNSASKSIAKSIQNNNIANNRSNIVSEIITESSTTAIPSGIGSTLHLIGSSSQYLAQSQDSMTNNNNNGGEIIGNNEIDGGQDGVARQKVSPDINDEDDQPIICQELVIRDSQVINGGSDDNIGIINNSESVRMDSSSDSRSSANSTSAMITETNSSQANPKPQVMPDLITSLHSSTSNSLTRTCSPQQPSRHIKRTQSSASPPPTPSTQGTVSQRTPQGISPTSSMVILDPLTAGMMSKNHQQRYHHHFNYDNPLHNEEIPDSGEALGANRKFTHHNRSLSTLENTSATATVFTN